jgi:hypothetical protein
MRNTSGSGSESYTPLQVIIDLNAPSGRDISIDYTTIDSTALGGGLDYEMSNGETRTAVIPAGTDSFAISLDIVNDASKEVPEKMKVYIDNPDYATIGAQDTFAYTILDDDGLGYIGPGGVGNAGQYKLWYRADAESYSDGAAVDSIHDQSGHGHHAYVNGADNPIFNDNAINNMPIITFDGNDALDINDSEDINTPSSPQTQRTFVVAFRTGADVNTRQVIYEEGGTGRGLNVYIENDSLYFGGWNNPEDPWQDFTYVTGEVQTNTVYYAILEMNATDTLFRGWMNGSLMGTETDVGPLYSHGGDIRFGANESAVYHDGNSNSDHFFNGDIMEFLSYNYTLNTAQQKIIENHFASKFRNQIETDLSTDLYNYRATYGYEVFGMGQDDIINNHTVTKGTGLIRFDQPSAMSDGDYLMCGHDNGDITSWTTTETPFDSVYRIARQWRVTKTNNLGNIRVAADSSVLPSQPDNYNLYALLVDQDGVFDSGDEDIYPMDIRSGSFVLSESINLADGDYFTIIVGRNRTVSSGDWYDPSIWLSAEVPGNNESVLITKGDTIDVSAGVVIGEVYVDSSAIVNINGNLDFEITEGDLDIHPDGTFNQSNGHIIYSADGYQCIGGMTYYDLTIKGSGAKELCGDITVTNYFIIFEEAPTLSLDVTTNNYSITLNCDWQNTGTFIPQDGTVIMNGINLAIDRDNNGAETFNILDVQTTGTLSLADNVIITDTLLMNGGNINTQTDTLTIGTGAGNAGILVRNSGTVLGNIQRWIDNTTDSYLYPIGTTANYQPMTIKANTLSGQGYAFGTYTNAVPGEDDVSAIYEDSLYMVNVFDEGYWSFITNGMVSSNYNVSVDANGFSSSDVISAGTRLLTRPNAGSNWTLDGDHANATGSIIRRDNVTTLSAQFGVCDTSSCMPNTSDISGNDTVCENVNDEPYSVINSAGSSYTWIIEGGTQASGSNTNSITVNWGAATNGRIRVVEDNGCAIGDTVNLDVLVKPYPDDPGAIAGPDTIVEGIQDTFSIAAVLNASYYTWTIPGDINGSSDSAYIYLNATVGSGGSDYLIEVEGTNSCGNSLNSSTKTVYVDYGIPAKPTTPIGPVTLCQDAPDTVYTTTSAQRATSYEWALIGGGSSGISGSDTAGTLDLSETFSGGVQISVRGVNVSGNGPWSDSLNVTINEQPDGNLSPVAGFESICENNSTQLNISFTGGTSPYEFIYSNGTTPDTINPVAADTSFFPINQPVWNEGKTDTTFYYILQINDAYNCSGLNVDTTSVIIFKKPSTGGEYYIDNRYQE